MVGTLNAGLPPLRPLMRIPLGLIDYAIMFIYFAFVLGNGWALKRRMKTSNDFFRSGKSIPA